MVFKVFTEVIPKQFREMKNVNVIHFQDVVFTAEYVERVLKFLRRKRSSVDELIFTGCSGEAFPDLFFGLSSIDGILSLTLDVEIFTKALAEPIVLCFGKLERFWVDQTVEHAHEEGVIPLIMGALALPGCTLERIWFGHSIDRYTVETIDYSGMQRLKEVAFRSDQFELTECVRYLGNLEHLELTTPVFGDIIENVLGISGLVERDVFLFFEQFPAVNKLEALTWRGPCPGLWMLLGKTHLQTLTLENPGKMSKRSLEAAFSQVSDSLTITNLGRRVWRVQGGPEAPLFETDIAPPEGWSVRGWPNVKEYVIRGDPALSKKLTEDRMAYDAMEILTHEAETGKGVSEFSRLPLDVVRGLQSYLV
jgi:hypothetical protein